MGPPSLTGFEDPSSSANVDTTNKAAAQRMYPSSSSGNLSLLNNGGNDHSVPATVPGLAPLSSLRTADEA